MQARNTATVESSVANNAERHPQPEDTIATGHADEPEGGEISSHVGPETSTGVAIAGTMRAGEAGSMPDDHPDKWVIEVGADVIGTCGHKIGEVVAVRDDHVVVEKGFFMPVDFYIPKSAIHHNNDHGLYLNVTKHEALHHGWDKDPEETRRAS
jgi:hypothetical protein